MLFALSTIALKFTGGGNLSYRHRVWTQSAANEEDAKILVMHKWKEIFPEKDGWSEYSITAQEVSVTCVMTMPDGEKISKKIEIM